MTNGKPAHACKIALENLLVEVLRSLGNSSIAARISAVTRDCLGLTNAAIFRIKSASASVKNEGREINTYGGINVNVCQCLTKMFDLQFIIPFLLCSIRILYMSALKLIFLRSRFV